MPTRKNRQSDVVSAPEYARRAGLDYGHVRKLAERGRIPGAEKIGGKWQLPEPVTRDDQPISTTGETMIAGYGDLARGTWVDVEKEIRETYGRFTKQTYRLWARHAPLDQIRRAEAVVFKSKGKSYRLAHGPLARMKPSTAANRLERRYGVGFVR